MARKGQPGLTDFEDPCKEHCVATREGTMPCRAVFLFAALVTSLLISGCDKCGDPIKLNLPSLPGACYDTPGQK